MSILEPHQPLRDPLLYAESLEEANERYEQIFNNSIDVIYLMEVTPDGSFIYRDVNTAYTEVTGIPREAVIGLSVEKIENETFRSILIDKFTTCLNAGGKTDYIAEYPFPSGVRVFHSTLSPMFDKNGRINRIVGIARDITEQKRHEEQIRHSEEAFRTLAENYPDIVVRYDRSCRRIYVNPAYEKIYGIQTKQLLETTPLEYSPLIAPRYFMGELTNAIESATPSDHELAVFRTDGEIGWYMVSLIPEYDGKQVNGILCVARDITQSKQYEMALQKSAQLEKMMSRMVANLPGFVYTLHRSPDGRASFPYASSGIYTLFGLLPEDVSQDMSILYTLIHPDDHHPIQEAVSHSAAEMSQCHIIFRTQIAGREERWIEARATPKAESDGEGILWHGMMLDITERKQHEKMFRDNEQKFLKTFMNSPVALAINDLETSRYIDVNDSFLTYTGYAREEVINRNAFEGINIWHDLADRETFLATLQKNGSVKDFDFRYKRKDGSMGYASVSATLVNINGRVCIVSQNNEISKRIITEQKIAPVAHHLKQ